MDAQQHCSLTGGFSPGSDRLAAFDALRAVAAVLVILLHAAIAYVLAPLPGLAWPTHDPHPSPAVDAIFWWIEGFIMPLFFLIAGFFAARLLGTRTPGAFLKHRARRLLVPLAFGCVAILPLDLYIWVFGWVADGRVPLRKMASLKFDDNLDEHLWGLSHLWFLQYLFLYCAGYAAIASSVKAWRARRPGGQRPAVSCQLSVVSCQEKGQGTRVEGPGPESPDGERRLALDPQPATLDQPTAHRSPLTTHQTLLLAVPCAAVLWFSPEVVTGFQHGFWPFSGKFLYTAVFFAGGAWLERFHDELDDLARWGGRYILGSAAVYPVMLLLIRRHNDIGLAGLERLALAGSIAVFAWLTVLGLLGVFLRHFNRPSRVLSYVAEASFWIYLLHHPLVGLAQIDLARASLPAWLKFWLVAGTALAFTLLTYQALVRYTWIGALLHGRRRPRPAPPSPQPAAAARSERISPTPAFDRERNRERAA